MLQNASAWCLSVTIMFIVTNIFIERSSIMNLKTLVISYFPEIFYGPNYAIISFDHCYKVEKVNYYLICIHNLFNSIKN